MTINKLILGIKGLERSASTWCFFNRTSDIWSKSLFAIFASSRTCTAIKAKHYLLCPRNNLYFTVNCSLFSFGASSVSHHLFLLTLSRLALCCLLSTLPIFSKHGDQIVFSHLIKTTLKCFDHFESQVIQHLLHLTTDTGSFTSCFALTFC